MTSEKEAVDTVIAAINNKSQDGVIAALWSVAEMDEINNTTHINMATQIALVGRYAKGEWFETFGSKELVVIVFKKKHSFVHIQPTDTWREIKDNITPVLKKTKKEFDADRKGFYRLYYRARLSHRYPNENIIVENHNGDAHEILILLPDRKAFLSCDATEDDWYGIKYFMESVINK